MNEVKKQNVCDMEYILNSNLLIYHIQMGFNLNLGIKIMILKRSTYKKWELSTTWGLRVVNNERDEETDVCDMDMDLFLKIYC